MADTYEKDLAQKTSLTTSDFIRVVGSDNVSYKQNVSNVNSTIPLTLVSGLTTEALIDQTYITAHTETPDGTLYRRLIYHAFAHSILGGGVFYLEGYRASSSYGWQRITSYGNPTRIFTRSINNGTWTTWAKEPTRAEVDALSTRTDITSSVTVNSKLTVNEFHVYKTGKVVSVLGAFTATDSIPNGEALISNLPTSGIGGNDICPMLTPVRASYWSTTPSKYHFQSLRNTEIVNGTTTLASGDVIQINLTYLAQ